MAKGKKTSIDIFWVDEKKLNARHIFNTVLFTVDNYKDRFPVITDEMLDKFEEDIYLFFKDADKDSDVYTDDHFKVFYIKNGVAGDKHCGEYLLSIQIFN